MQLFFRSKQWCFIALLTVVVALAGTAVRADDPDPQDTTGHTTTGTGTGPYHASEEAWTDATAVVLTIYPNADYATVCAYVLQWFNWLPPEALPPEELPPEEDPPEDPAPPAPTVATQEEWAYACSYITDNFFPEADAETLAFYTLEWFNWLPPETPPEEEEFPPEENPPEEPPPSPVVATPEEWADGCLYITSNFIPDADEETLEFYMLAWFNFLPPA